MKLLERAREFHSVRCKRRATSRLTGGAVGTLLWAATRALGPVRAAIDPPFDGDYVLGNVRHRVRNGQLHQGIA